MRNFGVFKRPCLIIILDRNKPLSDVGIRVVQRVRLVSSAMIKSKKIVVHDHFMCLVLLLFGKLFQVKICKIIVPDRFLSEGLQGLFNSAFLK